MAMTKHEHRHDHDPSGGVWARLGHAVSELVGGHSHDSAQQVDEALEANEAGRRALLLSLVILAATAGVQVLVVLLSGSVALLSDTLHNVADTLTGRDVNGAIITGQITLASFTPEEAHEIAAGRLPT